ncbi:MAG: urease accessory protein UreD, partial [Dolichospermum sp.]
GLAGKPVLGSLVWVGNSVSGEMIDKARSLIMENDFYGVTRLQQGFLCRYRGNSISEVRNWFTNIWKNLRINYHNRGNCIPRVWQI